MFYTNGRALYSLFWRANRNKAQGRWGYARWFGSMTALWFMPALLEGLFVPGRRPDDDEDEQTKALWWLWQFATFPTQAIPLVRDLARALEPGRGGYAEVFNLPPFRAFTAVFKAAGTLFDKAGDVILDDNVLEFEQSEVRPFVEAVGYWGHLPTGQMWTTGTYLYDWMMGYESPEGPVEAARNLAFPRPR